MAFSGTEIDICNLALNLVGITTTLSAGDGTIAGNADGVQETTALQRWYPHARNEVLEDYAWSFASVFATLTLADDGTGEAWSDVWENAYTYPSDCLRLRGFAKDPEHTPGTYGSQFVDRRETYPFARRWAYEVKQHDSAKVIMTNVATTEAVMEYTKLETTVTLFDSKFVTCVAAKIARYLAMSLAVSPEMEAKALRLYAMELPRAKERNENEQQERRRGDTGYVTSRAGY